MSRTRIQSHFGDAGLRIAQQRRRARDPVRPQILYATHPQRIAEDGLQPAYAQPYRARDLFDIDWLGVALMNKTKDFLHVQPILRPQFGSGTCGRSIPPIASARPGSSAARATETPSPSSAPRTPSASPRIARRSFARCAPAVAQFLSTIFCGAVKRASIRAPSSPAPSQIVVSAESEWSQLSWG